MSQSSFFAQTGLIILLIVIAIAAVVFALVRSRRKFVERIIAQFGKVPESVDKAVLRQLAAAWRTKQSKVPMSQCIDDITWNDLDMDRVFARIDACHTTVGEEYLYALLHMPAFDEAPLQQREALLCLLDAHPDLRLKLQMILAKMGKSQASGLLSFGYDAASKRLKHPAIYTALALVPLLCCGLFFVSWPLGLFTVLLSQIVNIVIYSFMKVYITRELAALRYFSTLLWCAKKICRLNLSPELTAVLSANLRVFKKVAGKISSITKYKLSDMDMMSEYFKIPFLSDIRNYNKAVSLIEKNTKAFIALYEQIGELDTAVTILSLRKSLTHWTCPEFVEARNVTVQGIYHPLLKNPVPNDAQIGRGSLISGSNASGKSTFIKALAINGIFAQTIHTCAAHAFRSPLALVMTSMAVRDDIMAGESYFITEIKSLRRTLDAMRSNYCICYIDEILKGTNTVERIAASAAVLGYLGTQPCLCIAATHDIELTRILAERFDNYHFEEQITDEGMCFDYAIKYGPSNTRNAIRLLDYMKFDAHIIDEALRMVKNFEQTGSWNEVR